MIGNDIVDLKLSRKQSNIYRKGLLEKICSSFERELIRSAPDPELEFWKLWTRKEAAYKIWHRQYKVRLNISASLTCSDCMEYIDYDEGTVTYFQYQYHTRTFVTDSFVLSIAGISAQVLDNSVLFVDNDYSGVHKKLFLKDSDGIPKCSGTSFGLHNVLSVSHHGSYCSYLSTTEPD